MGDWSLSNLSGVPGALLLLYVGLLVGMFGLSFAFRGAVHL